MIEEGFGEQDVLDAVAGRSRILEHYPDEGRCLLLGYLSRAKRFAPRSTSCATFLTTR
jgi:hypothetical protein